MLEITHWTDKDDEMNIVFSFSFLSFRSITMFNYSQYTDNHRKTRTRCCSRLSIRSIDGSRSSDVVKSTFFSLSLSHSTVVSCRLLRSKDGVVLSVNQEISGDRKKYEIIGKYDLIIKSISSVDSGRYLCQNFDQALSMTVILNVLSK